MRKRNYGILNVCKLICSRSIEDIDEQIETLLEQRREAVEHYKEYRAKSVISNTSNKPRQY
jgi:inorganic pyrophosphatase